MPFPVRWKPRQRPEMGREAARVLKDPKSQKITEAEIRQALDDMVADNVGKPISADQGFGGMASGSGRYLHCSDGSER
jgi:hypothetical protein